MRTGATGGIAAEHLARKDAKSLGVVGAGQQAFFQIIAINNIRRLKEVAVYDIAANNVANLRKALSAYIKIPLKMVSLQEAAQKDILVTATPSRKPFIKNSGLNQELTLMQLALMLLEKKNWSQQF